MREQVEKKRIVILANHRHARFVVAKGIKVYETVLCLSNRSEGHSEPLSHSREGHAKGTADSHFFPSHTDFKEVEKEAFAQEIVQSILKHFLSEEVILACEPKMLGLLKKNLSHHSSVKIYKTLPLDEVDIKSGDLEKKLLEVGENI